MRFSALILIAFASTLLADHHSEVTPEVTPLASYLEDAYTVDQRIIIGPQPSEGALSGLQSSGITTVINFRSLGEIESMSFDQPGLLADEGVAYHHIGISGGDSYTPEKLEQFNAAMEAAGTDQILLHCRSGQRASQMYAAWLVKYQGLSPDEALDRVAPSGWWPMPMEQLLGQPLSVSVEAP